MKEETDLQTADQIARRLKITRWKVYDLVRAGIIPAGAVIHLGRTIRFNAKSFDEFLKAGGATWPHGWRKTPGRSAR